MGGGVSKEEMDAQNEKTRKEYEQAMKNRDAEFKRQRDADQAAMQQQNARIAREQEELRQRHAQQQREYEERREKERQREKEENTRKEAEYRKQQQEMQQQFLEQMKLLANASAEDKKRMEEKYQEEQKRLQEERNLEKQRYEQKEEEYRQQRRQDQEEFTRRMEDMESKGSEERKQMLERFEEEQSRIAREREEEREMYNTRIESLVEGAKEAEKRLQTLTEELQKPVKDRESKIDFVNSLKLPIKETNNLVLVGPKGTGKSTFMWFLNRGTKPTQSFTDGTAEIVHLRGFVDSIGLRGWAPEEIFKLVVLLIYEGIPKDLIIFGNDRIDCPITALGLMGINNPLIVIMSSDFWKNYNKKKLKLRETPSGVRLVEPEEHLSEIYDLNLYELIKDLHFGQPVTHHDDIDELVQRRHDVGIRPFKFLLEKLGSTFTVKMANDNIVEGIFRFIYIFEKKYNRDQLKFMNSASMEDFHA